MAKKTSAGTAKAKAPAKQSISSTKSSPQKQPQKMPETISSQPVSADTVPDPSAAYTFQNSVLKNSSLSQLFVSSLREIYWAEQHLTQALPKMISATSNEELQTALQDHLAETEEQVVRLTKCLELTGADPIPAKCDAMDGLTASGEQVISNTPAGNQTRELAIIFSGLKVENFEATAYKGLIDTAGVLGLDQVASLLQENLDEEIAAGELLQTICTALLSASTESNN